MDVVTLAGFDFDSDRLEKGIEKMQKELFELTKSQQELAAQTKATNAELSNQTKEEERLVQSFKNGSQEYQKAVQDQAKLKKAGQENTQAYKDLNIEKQRLISTFKAESKEYQQVNQNISSLTNKQEGLFLATKDLQIQRSVLNKEYQTATTLYKQFIGVNGEVLSLQQVVNQSVKQEVTTRQQAKEVNQQLNKIKDQLNVTNEAEKQLLDEINQRIDENNKLLKETGSENEKRIAGIGQYSQGIEEAASNLDIFNGGLGGFIQRSQEAGGAGNLVGGSLKQMATGFMGVTKASLAFIATPIGLVLAAITAAFLLVRNAMNRSEEATNKINKVFGAFRGVLNFVLKALEPLGEILIDGIVKGFELATKYAEFFISTLKWIADNAADVLEALGFEGAADSVRTYTTAADGMAKAMLGAAEAGAKLAEMEAKLASEQRKSELIQEQYEVRAERLRQLRDDESKTINERIQANNELGKVLKQQLNEELNIAKLSLEVANTRLKLEGQTTANLEAQAKARVEIAKIENRITGQESEQQSNINSLRREAQSQAKAAHDARMKQIEAEIKRQKEALELWIAEQGDRARTLKEQLTLQEETAKKSKAILDNELKNKKISQEKYDLEVLKLTQETAKLQAQIAVDIAEQNLDTYIYENKERLKQGQLLTDDLLAQEIDRNKALQAERDAFEKIRFENGLINETEYQKALLENQRAYLDQERALKERNEQDNREIENTRRAEDFQAQLIQLQENLASEFEIKRAQANFEYEDQKLQLDQQRVDGLITEEAYQLALSNLKRKTAEVNKAIDKEELDFRLNLTKDTFSNVAQVLGEHTAAGKAAGIATATINTYQGASEVLKSPSVLPEPLNTILKVVQMGVTIGTGLNTVRNIAKVKAPKMAKGGLTEIGGKLHSQGGTKFYGEDGTTFEAEKGELIGVMNRSAASNFMNYNNSFLNNGSKTYPNFFADGGLVGVKSSNLATVQQNLFGNFSIVAISDAVRQGALEGSQQGSLQGSQQGTQTGSQQGISQLSSNRAVQGSSFI